MKWHTGWAHGAPFIPLHIRFINHRSLPGGSRFNQTLFNALRLPQLYTQLILCLVWKRCMKSLFCVLNSCSTCPPFTVILQWLSVFQCFVYIITYFLSGKQGKCLICNAKCQVSPLSDKVSILPLILMAPLQRIISHIIGPCLCFRAVQRWRPCFLTSTLWQPNTSQKSTKFSHPLVSHHKIVTLALLFPAPTCSSAVS